MSDSAASPAEDSVPSDDEAATYHLVEVPELGQPTSGPAQSAERHVNRLIHGENLTALRALEGELAGAVDCVFLDPPYNTGSSFGHYPDRLDHAVWLERMRERLEVIRRLMARTASLWITVDDHEAHYLKVLCDEVFGRNCYLGTIVWEKADSPRMDAELISTRHDYVLAHAKHRSAVYFAKELAATKVPDHYDRIAPDGRRYYLKPLRAMGHADTRKDRPSLYYPLQSPSGSTVFPRKRDGTEGRWRWGQPKLEREAARIEWLEGRGDWTPYYRIFAESRRARPVESIWTHSRVGSNRTAKAEAKALFPDVPAFVTPKPEKLLARILGLATREGDLVLDAYAGSGTTGAVAHKLGRRWVMIEVGDHCDTLIAPRLRKVIAGLDLGGVTRKAGWRGGGGFRYFRVTR